jgi:hypothetical protein
MAKDKRSRAGKKLSTDAGSKNKPGNDRKVIEEARTEKRRRGRPPVTHNRIRFTTIIEPELRRKMKTIAALNERAIHDVFNEALQQYVDRYEQEHGEV